MTLPERNTTEDGEYMNPPAATKRISLDARSERDKELVSALNELNLAIRMLDRHLLTDRQRHHPPWHKRARRGGHQSCDDVPSVGCETQATKIT
jgi:hypothetical protein